MALVLMVKKPGREEEKCDLADGQDMQAREASPEAGGHSLLLNGGLAGMEAHAGLARGCDGPKQGTAFTARHREGGKEEKKGQPSERHAGQLGGSTSKRLPRSSCAK